MKEITLKDNANNYRVVITDTIDGVSEDWNQAINSSIYSNSNYISLLESDGPLGFQYYYALVYSNDEIQSVFYFQKKTIHLAKDFRIHTHSKNFFAKLRVTFLKWIFKFVNHEFLVCGNVLLTGEYAYAYKEQPSPQFYDQLLKEVILFIKEKTKKKVKTILLKDFYTDSSIKNIEVLGTGYTKLEVQPDMIFHVEDRWETFEDYLAEVKSKYRVKFKKVKKQAKDLDLLIMTKEDAEKYSGAMYALYKATADRALFSLFTLSENYFTALKKSLGDDLILIGVFKEERLLGFFTFVKNGEFGDAHFLGYDVKENSKYQIYFNILLRLIKEAIDQKVKYLNLSRTALEIKSSVGAVPYDMNIYVKHTNSIVNKMLPWILSKTVPENDWVPRSPYGVKSKDSN
ncbi:GNAT family N-acetyltransferase [Saprospiraceae bacterium]|nr:GNAT family N-acetyltransferase [Saprospiraceae bacterium]